MSRNKESRPPRERCSPTSWPRLLAEEERRGRRVLRPITSPLHGGIAEASVCNDRRTRRYGVVGDSQQPTRINAPGIEFANCESFRTYLCGREDRYGRHDDAGLLYRDTDTGIHLNTSTRPVLFTLRAAHPTFSLYQPSRVSPSSSQPRQPSSTLCPGPPTFLSLFLSSPPISRPLSFGYSFPWSSSSPP